MRLKFILSSAVIASTIIGCGGGGSDASDSSQKYIGSIAPGDMLSIDIVGEKIKYHLKDDTTSVDEKGEIDVKTSSKSDLILEGKIGSKDAYFLPAKKVIFTSMPIGGKERIGVALSTPKNNLSEADVVGNYIFAEANFASGSFVDSSICYMSIEADNKAYLSCDGLKSLTNRWDISKDKKYLLFRYGDPATAITSGDEDARVIIKTPESTGAQKGFIFDKAAGEGFGIGLSINKALNRDDFIGEYLIIDFAEDEMPQITLRADVSNPNRLISRYKGADVGTFTVNRDCDGSTKDGIICVLDKDGKRHIGIIDKENGYYVFIAEDGSNFILAIKK